MPAPVRTYSLVVETDRRADSFHRAMTAHIFGFLSDGATLAEIQIADDADKDMSRKLRTWAFKHERKHIMGGTRQLISSVSTNIGDLLSVSSEYSAVEIYLKSRVPRALLSEVKERAHAFFKVPAGFAFGGAIRGFYIFEYSCYRTAECL